METNSDKSKELNSSITLVNDRLHFKGCAGSNEPVSIDYFPPLGDNAGYTSLELLLLSLSSCMGSAVLTFLRRMKKSITGCEIRAEHPTGFKTIHVMINLKSPDVTNEDLDKVLKLSEETYCPVWSMLKGNVEINVKYKIIS